jgi:hypothetical protein
MAIIVLIALLVLLLALVVGVGITFFDVSGRREDRAEGLQAKILDCLSYDPRLKRLRLLPVVHVPTAPGSPLRVEILGPVPSDELREITLDVVGDAASKMDPRTEVDDRLEVVPVPAHPAA